MRNLIKFLCLFLIFSLMSIQAKVKIENIEYKKGELIQFEIKFDSQLLPTKEVLFKENVFQISFADTYVWPKLQKEINIEGKPVTLMAYQFDKDTVRFRVVMPYSVESWRDEVNIKQSGDKVIVSISTDKKTAAVPAFKSNRKDNYDEAYLEKLLVDRKNIKKQQTNNNEVKSELLSGAKEDAVNLSQSAGKKDAAFERGGQISIVKYIGKFVAFLSLVIILFYAFVHFFKKGIFNKSKIGLLRSDNLVQVLNTTYLGPKKSLHLIQANKQIFLIGSGEGGITLISEVRDSNAVVKNAEMEMTGENFDSNITKAGVREKSFKLKEENVLESANRAASGSVSRNLDEFLGASPVQDKIKISDQIKNKVKSLKALQ